MSWIQRLCIVTVTCVKGFFCVPTHLTRATPNDSNSAMKRKRFSYGEKYRILAEFDQGAKRSFLQEKYGLPHGTLAGIIKKRREIEARIRSTDGLQSKSSKQSRYPDVDSALVRWFRSVRTDSPETPISGNDLHGKAIEIYSKLQERGVLTMALIYTG